MSPTHLLTVAQIPAGPGRYQVLVQDPRARMHQGTLRYQTIRYSVMDMPPSARIQSVYAELTRWAQQWEAERTTYTVRAGDARGRVLAAGIADIHIATERAVREAANTSIGATLCMVIDGTEVAWQVWDTASARQRIIRNNRAQNRMAVGG